LQFYTTLDEARLMDEAAYRKTEYRSSFRRDIDRLIHSTCFRRLQGKTQLYPGFESDFFRNRLTHSLEVAQIARSIAAKINFENKHLFGESEINLDIVEFAGLAHDLGHPPFGHQGEEKLDELMRDYGGFEGNAQTLRLLTRIEKKGFFQETRPEPIVNFEDKRIGLNLTARSLASILKYDNAIEYKRPAIEKVQKGYYSFDAENTSWIKKSSGGSVFASKFKSIECQIMDLADDISYSTYDLEDGLKACFFSIQDVVFPSLTIRQQIGKELNINADVAGQTLFGLFEEKMYLNLIETIFDSTKQVGHAEFALQIYNELFKEFSRDGYARNALTSWLVNRFIEGIEFTYEPSLPSQSTVKFKPHTLLEVEVLKKFTFTSEVLSSRLKVPEYRGKEIVEVIFLALTQDKGFELLPVDYRNLYEKVSDNERKRIICDFVSGMTDRYAIEFYGRLKSENPKTIFKPL
jgi:dGTPase